MVCVECGTTADDGARGWRAYLKDDGQVALFCVACSVREFGPRRTRPLADDLRADNWPDLPGWLKDDE